jgi:hypothetical protein
MKVANMKTKSMDMMSNCGASASAWTAGPAVPAAGTVAPGTAGPGGEGAV